MEHFLSHTEEENAYKSLNSGAVVKQPEPDPDRINMAESLFGIIPADLTLEEVRAERLNQV